MPDVHHDDGGPRRKRARGVVVVDAEPVNGIAEEPNVPAPEHLPDGANDVPRDEQWQRHDDEAKGRHQRWRGIESATTIPRGTSIRRMMAENRRLRQSKSKKRSPSSA